MPDFTTAKQTLTQSVEIDRVFVAGEECEFVFGKGTQLFPNIPIPLYGATECRMTLDADGYWMEFGFRIDTPLAGNAGAGWNDAGNYLRLEVQQSADLQTWSMGKFYPSPVPVVDRLDGTWEYWGRSTVPVYWKTTLRDFRLTATDYGKSITEIYCYDTAITLAGYPYAMPADKGRLQADLRAAGYTGALVTSTTAALTVKIINHTVDSQRTLPVTQSGTNVTAVAPYGSSAISLPSYPYAMPSQKAALQADLRAAGYSGAVVKLFAEEWDIYLPDRSVTGSSLPFHLTITPGDPFKFWDFYGNYQGEAPDTERKGGFENTRDLAGNPLQEANRQFARLKITTGSRYNAYL